MILISGCLTGLRCRYDGKQLTYPAFQELIKSARIVIVCPEQLGGLSTPRSASQIVGGDGFDVLSGKARVISEDGRDVTENFIRGAEETLHIARLIEAEKVILKERSPSCGIRKIYRKDQLIDGCGVTAALLIREGYRVEPSDTE